MTVLLNPEREPHSLSAAEARALLAAGRRHQPAEPAAQTAGRVAA